MADIPLYVVCIILISAVVKPQTVIHDCRLDICFILDESGSVGPDNFDTVKNFVSDFVGRLPIGEQLTRVGVVEFSSSASLNFNLNAHMDKASLKLAIEGLTYSGGYTNLGQGLIVARTNCFNTEGDRPDVPNIAILITDGLPNRGPPSEQEAITTREVGIDIVAIGVGNIDFSFLRDVANGEQNVFEVDFKTLLATVENIQSQSCTYARECPKGSFAFGSKLLNCPTLHKPNTDNPEKDITFTCSLNYSSDVPSTTRYRVSFLFDGKVDNNFPTTIINPPDQTVTLHEYYLQGHLGQSLSCGVEVEDGGSFGDIVYSRSYWLGILPSHNIINMFESDDLPTDVYFYNTLPIGCAEPNKPTCILRLRIRTTGHIGVIQEDGYNDKRCRYSQRNKEWIPEESLTYNPLRPLYVFPKGDPFHGANRESSITFKTIYYEKEYTINGDRKPYSIWKDYKIDPIKVVVHDTPHGRCTSSGDPHVTTFDGRKYDAMKPGVYNYVVTTGHRNYTIQGRHKPCDTSGRACAYACAVVVQDGPYQYAIDNCGSHPSMFSGPLKFSEPDEVDEGVGIFGKLKNWEIRMLSGVVVSIRVYSGFINLDIQVPGRERGKTQGICGNFDGIPDNDLKIHDKIPLSESLFFDISTNKLRDHNTNVCDCSKPGAADVDKASCGIKALQDSTLTPAFLKKRARALKPRYLTNHGHGGRRRKRSTHDVDDVLLSDDINDEYYPSYIDDSPPVSDDPPAWGTFNISESEARALCESHIYSLSSYKMCLTYLSDDDIENTVFKCMDDIRRSGDLTASIEARDFEFQNDCKYAILNQTEVTNRDDPMSDPVFSGTFAAFMNTLCPNNCSLKGDCISGLCNCYTGLYGPDCSYTTMTLPVISAYLGPVVCDVQERICTSVRVQAEQVVPSDNLKCRVNIFYGDGTSSVLEADAEQETEFILRCPLLNLLNETETAQPYYSYHVSLSNDGTKFSDPLPLRHFVADSICIECNNVSCTKKRSACLIDGSCYEPGDLPDVPNGCHVCDPSKHTTAWSAQTGDLPVFSSRDTYIKVVGEDLTIHLNASDPYGSGVSFSLIQPVNGVALSPSGTLFWTTFKSPVAVIRIRIEAKACPRFMEQEIRLTSLDCKDICYNGNCVPRQPVGGGLYDCDCHAGFTGTQCETNLDDCFSQPCVHGSCVDLDDSYSCVCEAGFTGIHCDTNIDECSSNPCMHGSCSDDIAKYACHCAAGYTGATCAVEIDECASSPCVHGTCVDRINGYLCSCMPGYTGDDCQLEIDACVLVPCVHGVCDDQQIGYACLCEPGYTSSRCEVDIDDCAGVSCNRGICIDGINSFTCECDSGFTGTFCQININDCKSSPCVHGSCIDLDDSYSCVCLVGYTGVNCQTNSDECSSNPCKHGSCSDDIAKFVCYCDDGYTGDTCAVEIDECASSPCVHGTCADQLNSYHCSCIAGYTGDECQLEIDACVLSPCVHGVCDDQKIGYACLCDPGYSGNRCEVDVDDCATISCNRGICLDGINSFTCECESGFTGTLCQNNINDCKSSPCVHGDCIDGDDSYTCKCDEHYTGRHCDSQINYCEGAACQNGGTCEPYFGGSSCSCLADFTGAHCETRLPDVGDVGEWTDFGPCSKACDYGLQGRTRKCLRDPCDLAAMTEQRLCATTNCEEIPVELDESTAINISTTDVKAVIMSLDNLTILVTGLMNKYCSQHIEECCTAVELRTLKNPSDVAKIFTPNNIIYMSGYPKVLEENVIRLLLKVEVSLSQLTDVCVITSRRRKRQVQDMRTVDKALVERSLEDGKEQLSQMLGFAVSVVTPDSVDPLVVVYISVGVVAAVLLLAFMAVIYVCCLHKRDSASRDTESKHLDSQKTTDKSKHRPRRPTWRLPRTPLYAQSADSVYERSYPPSYRS